MKKYTNILLGFITTFIVVGSSNAVSAGQEKIQIFIMGDSTAQYYSPTDSYPRVEWGTELDRFFSDNIVVEDYAVGGATAYDYSIYNIDRYEKLMNEIGNGDYVLIQFGINDLYEDRYKESLENYVEEIRERNAIPVILSGNVVLSWNPESGKFRSLSVDLVSIAESVAQEKNTAYINTNGIELQRFNEIADYYKEHTLLPPNEYVLHKYFASCEEMESSITQDTVYDNIHLKKDGAFECAKLIADELVKVCPELEEYRLSDTPFIDIEDHWAEQTINDMYQLNLLEGVSKNEFEPEGTVTRAEFLKFVMDAANIYGHYIREGECLDATIDDWYCKYLQGALDKDLIPESMITDCSVEKQIKVISEATDEEEAKTVEVNVYSGEFNGDNDITREEMAALAVSCILYADESIEISEGDVSFADADQISEEYIDAVNKAVALNILNGFEDNTFRPKDTLTRAQAATIAERVYELLNNE